MKLDVTKYSFPMGGWSKRTNEVGNTYGRLTVKAYHSTDDLGSHSEVWWVAECECGSFELYERRYLRGTSAPKPPSVHECSQCRAKNQGYTKSPVYQHWYNLMRKEDLDDNCKDFAYFRASFERDYVLLRADHYAEDAQVHLRKANKKAKHGLGNSTWEVRGLTTKYRVLRLHGVGLEPAEIARKLQIDFASVTWHLKKAGLYEAQSREEYNEKLRDPEHARRLLEARKVKRGY